MAHVFISFNVDPLRRADEVAAIITELERIGMKACDISDNEMAKSHGRYMIGGCQSVPNERLFRFG